VPDAHEQVEQLWSAVGVDEESDEHVLYATATPGVLKLWPWANQVRPRRRRRSAGLR
jgi:chloride channel 3/4/5